MTEEPPFDVNPDQLFSGLGEESLLTIQDGGYGVTDVVELGGIKPTDEEWSDKVMDLFAEDELIEGMPNVAGLRRVAQVVLGRIVSSRPTMVIPSKVENDFGKNVAVYEVVCEDGRVYADAADTWFHNTDDQFLPFGLATAVTRAEARALRKALGIKKVSFDEITTKDSSQAVKEAKAKATTKDTTGEYAAEAPATDKQMGLIEVKCKQLSIDKEKLLEELGFNPKETLTKSNASLTIDRLMQIQSSGITPPNITK